MASSSPLVLILLALSPFLFCFTSQVYAQRAPAPARPANLTGILDKAGQFTTFIRLLTSTQISNQIENQLNYSSDQGLTVLAPTDNAFNNLKAGTINSFNMQEQVELILYHAFPKFYSLADLLSVSNPVRTQATGQDGGLFGLNFTSSANQVNVSSGIVTTQLNNALSKDFPLAVYQVDKVLLPLVLFGPIPSEPSPSPSSPADKPKKAPTTSGPSASKDTTGGPSASPKSPPSPSSPPDKPKNAPTTSGPSASKDTTGGPSASPKPSPSPSSPADKPKKAPATSGPSASKDADASGSIAMNVGLSGMLVLIGSMWSSLTN